ncbi:MAG: hypothetical protein AB7G93_17380 [Bdellovibrionales bacterium]
MFKPIIGFLLASAFCLSGAHADAQTQGYVPALIGTVSPYQTWADLGANAMGMLVSAQVLDIPLIDHGWGIYEDPKRTEYKFMQEGLSPVAMYFVSDGRGFNFLKDWSTSDMRGFRADAAMFSAHTPNEWGLKDDAHIVTVEVNGGRGGDASIHFIATGVEIQQTLESDLRPHEILHEALGPYADRNSRSSQEIRETLQKAIEAARWNRMCVQVFTS